MGRYLEILRRLEVEPEYDINDINDKSPSQPPPDRTFGRFCRFCRTCQELERRCPDQVEPDRWEQAIRDAHAFLPVWSEKAEALGWTARELFGLHPVPERPAASYRRLARYDDTGLIWLLQGRLVVALTAGTAAIETKSGGKLIYRKYNKPGIGPFGDSLDDMGPAA